MESTNRKRLGRAVVARRVELGMLTTKALADEAKLSSRMLGDVENGRRDNYSDGAKAQIERALRWDPGSIDLLLEGKEAVVSGAIRNHAGTTLWRWKAVRGAEQEELEAYRLAYITIDARDLVRSQKGPLNAAITALLDEAVDLQLRRVARWRSGDDELTEAAMADANWFLSETRDSNNIRRQGDIYVVDDTDTRTPEQRANDIADIKNHLESLVRAVDDSADDEPPALPAAARTAPPGYRKGESVSGPAVDDNESQDLTESLDDTETRDVLERLEAHTTPEAMGVDDSGHRRHERG